MHKDKRLQKISGWCNIWTEAETRPVGMPHVIPQNPASLTQIFCDMSNMMKVRRAFNRSLHHLEPIMRRLLELLSSSASLSFVRYSNFFGALSKFPETRFPRLKFARLARPWFKSSHGFFSTMMIGFSTRFAVRWGPLHSFRLAAAAIKQMVLLNICLVSPSNPGRELDTGSETRIRLRHRVLRHSSGNCFFVVWSIVFLFSDNIAAIHHSDHRR